MPVNAVLGYQRGDEGKGRFVDMLAQEHDVVARFNGGNNAGHTVILPDSTELDLHLVPSGIAHEETLNVIGNGVLVDPVGLVKEIEKIRDKGIEVSPDNLVLSSAAHVVLPNYKSEDEIREAGAGGQGSTKMGIAQTAAGKSLREGLRVEDIKTDPLSIGSAIGDALTAQQGIRRELGLDDLDVEEISLDFVEAAQKLAEYVRITDTSFLLNCMLAARNPARVLAEGAQAFLLDPDHGMYPYVTSTPTTIGGISYGLGIPGSYVNHVTGVVKAVQSHVGGGPFVTEIDDQELLSRLHGDMAAVDAEKGTTTGRVRRLGHLDLPQIRRAIMVNEQKDRQEIALSKLDWVSRYGSTILVCTGYERKGKILHIAPDSARKLDESKPIYEELAGWDEDISDVRDFDALPKNAQNYVRFVEDQLEVPIHTIGVGPKRDQFISR